MDIGGGSPSIMSPLMNGLLLSAFGLLLRKQAFRPSCEFVFFWKRILRWFSPRSWIRIGKSALKVAPAMPGAILVLTSSANFRQTILTYFQQILPIFTKSHQFEQFFTHFFHVWNNFWTVSKVALFVLISPMLATIQYKMSE